ncbi:hypothetical protein NKG05_10520 [Oerskovia sp. M15]
MPVGTSRLDRHDYLLDPDGHRCAAREPFEAESDEAALDVVRARKRSGNLPLTSFTLQASDDRTVASWTGAHEVV